LAFPLQDFSDYGIDNLSSMEGSGLIQMISAFSNLKEVCIAPPEDHVYIKTEKEKK